MNKLIFRGNTVLAGIIKIPLNSCFTYPPLRAGCFHKRFKGSLPLFYQRSVLFKNIDPPSCMPPVKSVIIRKIKEGTMKNTRRILATIMIILLIGMYVLTLIFAITDHTKTMGLFKISLCCTFFFPVILYACSLAYRVTHSDDTDNIDSDE